MSIRVLKPGLLTTVQDGGRTGYQKYGVIVSGAMDAFAYRAANLLVGNGEQEAALEVTLLGPHMEFGADHLIAICGGDLSPSIDGRPVPLWRPVLVRRGSTLRFGAAAKGCRCYIAAAGGFELPLVMGSYSTYLRAGIGGFEGRALREGDELIVRPPQALGRLIGEHTAQGHAEDEPFAAASWFMATDMLPDYRKNPVLRVLEGPQLQAFATESIADFFCGEFAVQPQSDRMGYRVQGPGIRLKAPLEMISEPVTFGTVQVPPDGNPIVLMADRQTTGGYPKIAQVITADLPLVAQAQIGSRIRFRQVGLREAQELSWIREMELELLKRSISIRYR